MIKQVVGVHGIGNRAPGKTPAEAAAALGERWTAALRRGLGLGHSTRATVAYYAHHLVTNTAQAAGDPEYLDEAEQEMLLRWAAELGAPSEIAQGRLAAPARTAADWIARKFGLDSKLVRLLVTTFCREVHLYFSEPACRDSVQAAVVDTIASVQPAAVIAHSLGSVVAYETLWGPGLSVDLLITLGSPLALPGIVFPRLHPAPQAGKGQRPPGVRRWINIADPGDFIAIPRGLAHHFDGIDADLTTPVGVFNAHKVTGYLACSTTAAALATLLGADPLKTGL